MERLCSRCWREEPAPGQRWCRRCRAAYMREWRKSHPMTEEQRRRDIARSKAGVYLRRGKIIRKPCGACGERAEMHHPDYDKPYDVVWLCRRCHLDQHHQ